MMVMKHIASFWANWRRRLGVLAQRWFARVKGCNLYPPPSIIPAFPGKIAPLCDSPFLFQASGEALDSHENSFPAGSGGGRLFFPNRVEAKVVWKPPWGRGIFLFLLLGILQTWKK